MSGSCGRFGARNARFLGRCGALDYRVFGRFGALGARCFGRFGWMLVFGLFFRALHGCQTHDKRMTFMGHSLRAHAVLMLTHAFGALDLKQMALTSGSCGTHVDSCTQLARHSTGFVDVTRHSCEVPICTIPIFQILGLYVMFSLATLQFYFPEHFIPNPVALPPRGPAF